MKNPNQSNEATEKNPLIDRRTAITGLVSFVCLGMGLKESCFGAEKVEENPALAYVGTWKFPGYKPHVKISNWPEENEKRPSKTIKLGKDKEANLILPVVSNGFMKLNNKRKFKNIYGGFYDVDGMHVLILWFSLKGPKGKDHGTSLSIAFRKKGDVIEIRSAPEIQKYLTAKNWKFRIDKPKWEPIKPVK